MEEGKQNKTEQKMAEALKGFKTGLSSGKNILICVFYQMESTLKVIEV